MKTLGFAILTISTLSNTLLFAEWITRGCYALAACAAGLVVLAAVTGVLWGRYRFPV